MAYARPRGSGIFVGVDADCLLAPRFCSTIIAAI